MKLAAITVCKNRLEDLRRTLPHLSDAGFDEVILVDYACPENCGDWARTNTPTVNVIVQSEDSGFNVSRARNLGAQAAKSDWFFFVDADIFVKPGLASYIRNHYHPSYFFKSLRPPGQRVTAWGSVVVGREAFERVGGYDEVYAGWGCEDEDFFYKLLINGTRELAFPTELVDEIRTPKEKKVEYSPIKRMEVQQSLNRMYLQLKKLVWASGQDMSELPLSLRQSLYAAASSHTEELLRVADTPGATLRARVKLPKRASRVQKPLIGMQTVSAEFEISLPVSPRP